LLNENRQCSVNGMKEIYFSSSSIRKFIIFLPSCNYKKDAGIGNWILHPQFVWLGHDQNEASNLLEITPRTSTIINNFLRISHWKVKSRKINLFKKSNHVWTSHKSDSGSFKNDVHQKWDFYALLLPFIQNSHEK